LRSYQLVCFDK